MRKITHESSLPGTIDGKEGNTTTIHLHYNFPGISHIHHQFNCT